jgi:hypothetical protein
VPSPPRDKDATWRSTNAFGWSKARLRDELLRGRPYRTFPSGHTFDWSDPYLWIYFNIEASEISIPSGAVVDALNAGVAQITGRPPPPKRRSGLEGMTIGIEVLDGEVPSLPSPSANAPAASPAPKRPSDAAVEQCLCGIKQEYPDGPSSERWLLTEMEERLGAPPGRERVRNLRREKKYRQWRRPIGHPRNFNSAKKSAE